MLGLFAVALAAFVGTGAGDVLHRQTPVNGGLVPLVWRDGAAGPQWHVEDQDWGGHPPRVGPRTAEDSAPPTGWYKVRANGSDVLVMGRVDASGRLVWRWDEQRGGRVEAPGVGSTIDATDPRANGVLMEGLVGRGVQASDATVKGEVESVLAGDAEADRLRWPAIQGPGLDLGTIAAYAALALGFVVLLLSMAGYVVYRIIRGARGP